MVSELCGRKFRERRNIMCGDEIRGVRIQESAGGKAETLLQLTRLWHQCGLLQVLFGEQKKEVFNRANENEGRASKKR